MASNEEFGSRGYVQDLDTMLECLNPLTENLKTGNYEERAEILQKMYDRLAIRIKDKSYIKDYWILYTQLGV